MGPLRWGLISAGKISYDFALASSALPKEEHELRAVAARDLTAAKNFAKEFNIPKAYGDYEELMKDKDIDVVYIGSVNPTHLPLAKLALNHGKNVLCEKPLCMNVKEAEELLGLAKEKGLFLMEALWSRFFPAYQRLREEITKGTIGEVLQVFVSFGVEIAEVDRVKLKELGGGGVLDIGTYCANFAVWVYGGEMPEKILSGGHLNKHGVDESTSTTLVFKGGRTATLITHCKVTMPNEAFAVGTKGTLKLGGPFWCSTSLTLPSGETVTFPLPPLPLGKECKFWNSMGLSYQAKEVRRCIQAGLKESPVMPHKDSLLLAHILQSIRKQVGVVYPQDA